MLVIRSDVHTAHHCLELDGAELIDSWESPARAEHVDAAVDAAVGLEVIGPDGFDRAAAEAVHDPDYVAFLSTAWDRWTDEGNTTPAAMAFGWPARRFRDIRPHNLEAQLGYYSFAADCSIAAGTWVAVAESAAIAQTATDRVLAGERVAFARCRPPMKLWSWTNTENANSLAWLSSAELITRFTTAAIRCSLMVWLRH